MELKDFFNQHPRAALAFSGGTDSAYLLYAGLRLAEKLGVYYVHTAFQPMFELLDAKRMARQLGAELCVLEADVLACPQVTANPKDRCYHCKKIILSAIQEKAAKDGFEILLDGTNASDDPDDRPGFRALTEWGVLSPLRLCGITKAEVRRLSREAGLFTWNKPAYACLATRIRSGEEITGDKLRAIEKSEDMLFQMGFSDFRVRTSGGSATLQFTAAQQRDALQKMEEIRKALSPFFSEICMDSTAREASI